MRENSLALRKQFAALVISAVLTAAGNFLAAQDGANAAGEIANNVRAYEMPGSEKTGETLWYRSNPSGMALEFIPSRLAALRNEYALSVEELDPEDRFKVSPAVVLPFLYDSYRVELRTLYKNGEELRRQWIFRDEKGNSRLTASGNDLFFGVKKTETGEEEKLSGFIEILDDKGFITREFRFENDFSVWEFRYIYRANVLLYADTWLKEPAVPSEENIVQPPVDDQALWEEVSSVQDIESAVAESLNEEKSVTDHIQVMNSVGNLVFTDYYRYSRSGSLRAIERIIHDGTGTQSMLSFPRLGPGVSTGDEFYAHGITYTSEFLSDINVSEGTTVNYSMDSRGRILGEVWKDPEGNVLGEYRNTWFGDRLQSVLWKSPNDERLVEYEYDGDDNRIAERNFRRGVLERSVTSRNGRDVEEIYMDGRLILRTYWENGLKISEERIPSSGRLFSQ